MFTRIRRALRWRCPTCGQSAVFKPLAEVRSLDDWFTPLDGCAICDYHFEREPGYFLLAIWGVNYGVIAVVFLAVTLPVAIYFRLGALQSIWLVLPMPLCSLLFARHAKTLYMAINHWFDPPADYRKDQASD